MKENLTYKTVHGIKWNYFSTLVTAVMQIGYTATMARLLEPAAFGLVAMSGVILRFGSYFAEMGIERAVIQKKDINEEDIKSSFTLSILLGIIFFLILLILAPYALYIFNDGKVVSIIKIMAISFLISGFSATSLALLKRKLKFKALAIIEITSYIFGYLCIGITMAALGFGVWSLIFASLSQLFFATVIAYIIVKHSLSFTFSLKNYRPLFSFGSKVTIISFFEFIGGTLDTLLIGRFWGASLLGIYNRASMIINLPLLNLNNSITKVLFPSFSLIQSDKSKLKTAFISAFSVSSFFLIPLCIWFSVSAKEVILVILGTKWQASIQLLKILAFVSPFYLINNYMGILLEATAYLKRKLILQIIYVILLSLVLFKLLPFGTSYVALGLLGSIILQHIGYLYLTKSLLALSFKEIISVYYPTVTASFIIGLSIFLINLVFIKINLGLFFRFLFQIIIFVGIMLILLKLSYFYKIKEILNERVLVNFNNNIIIRLIKKFNFV